MKPWLYSRLMGVCMVFGEWFDWPNTLYAWAAEQWYQHYRAIEESVCAKIGHDPRVRDQNLTCGRCWRVLGGIANADR